MGRFHMFLVVIFFFSFFGKERTTIHRRFWRGVSKSHTFPLTKRYVGKAFPMYFQYISHACWPRILPVYFHVFFFCWLVGPKFLRSISVFLFQANLLWFSSSSEECSELPAHAVECLVWIPSPTGRRARCSRPRWFADGKISRIFIPSAKKYRSCFDGLGFLETRRDFLAPVWSWTFLIFVLQKTTVSGVNSLQFVFPF